MGWIGDSAQIASTVFAAGAAVAAWASVKQGQRVWRASIAPDVHLQILQDVTHERMQVVLTNQGGGMAKGTGYQIASGGRRVHGFLGDGFLAPGDKVLISTDLSGKGSEAQIVYRTADESLYVVTRDGHKQLLRAGRDGGSTTGDEAWKRMHPGVPWGDLPFGHARVQWVEKRGTVVAQLPPGIV